MKSKSAQQARGARNGCEPPSAPHAAGCPASSTAASEGPVNIELDHKELFQNLRNEKLPCLDPHAEARGEAKSRCCCARCNMHPFKLQVQHVDFQRVSKDKKIHMKVPLHFVNAEKSPGVKEQGGIASHVLNELDITCFPDDLPEFIEVDLANLTVGHSLHVRDLALPKGVELALHKDENPVVATVVIPALVAEEEEAAPAVPARRSADHRAGGPAEGRRRPPRRGGRRAARSKARAEKPAAGDKPARRKRRSNWRAHDPPRCRPGQPGQGVRAHAPQRRVLAGRAFCAGARRGAAQGPEVQGAGGPPRSGRGCCCRRRS